MAWTDMNALAGSMSADKEVLRTLFQRKGYAGANALVYSENHASPGGTNGRVVVALFRVQNTSASPIQWSPAFRYSAFGGFNEFASVALNGVTQWNSAGATVSAASGSATVPLTIPANRTSTVIFVVPGGPPYNVNGSFYIRTTALAFISNSLALPSGLQFVDDLATASGDYSQ